MTDVVELSEVKCVARGVPVTRALVCRVRGRDVTVFVDDIQDGSEIRKPGDEGKLVLPLWVAIGLGLVRPAARIA
jgi:hypothetical protein